MAFSRFFNGKFKVYSRFIYVHSTDMRMWHKYTFTTDMSMEYKHEYALQT